MMPPSVTEKNNSTKGLTSNSDRVIINNSSTQLLKQINDESFEDVNLDLELEKFQNQLLSNNHSTPRQYLHHHHHHSQHNHHYNRHYSSPIQSSSTILNAHQPALQLTPSQRLRIRRKQLNEDLKSSIRHDDQGISAPTVTKNLDFLSDDDLPDDLIVYNVPLSQSLKLLSSREQFIMSQPVVNNYSPQAYYFNNEISQPPLRQYERSKSLTDSNRSSIFSYKSTTTNATEDSLSLDLKFFTIELNKNIDVIQNEESQQRVFELRKLMSHQNRSVESIHSTKSGKSVTSELTSRYLTNTRPTNLPPKDKFEILKHSKDYESLLNHALKEEQRKCHNQDQTSKTRERQKSLDLDQWKLVGQDLLKNLSKPSTRELWWRGVPKQYRPQIWTQQIGNKLQIERATVVGLFNTVVNNEKLMDNINLYCYPNLAIFHNNENLYKVISLYLTSIDKMDKFDDKSMIGLYSLSATLLYNIKSPIDTFIALSNLLHRKLPHLFINNLHDEQLNLQIKSFDKIFKQKLHRLSTHFQIYDVTSYEFLQWLCSYCLTQYLDLTKSSTLLDIYLFEGDSFLLRCVLGFLQKVDYKLFGNKQEIRSILEPDCLINLNKHLFNNLKNGELVYGYKYLDLGLDEDFFLGIRNILRD